MFFQVCSLFGRIRIHGYNLRPLIYYSVYNYRTNSPLSIEFISQIKYPSQQDINLFIPDMQISENIIFKVNEKGGDVLLIRKEPKNDSLFIKIIREHRMYSNWFLEKYLCFQGGRWTHLDHDLHIRLIETTYETTVNPSEELIAKTNHVIRRWINETTEDLPFVVLICGEKDLGKSTFTRYLINRALNHVNPVYNVSYFDCDIGQCEFTIGGCVSYSNLNSPLFGPPCSHIQSNTKPNRLLYYGLVSPQTSPVYYLQCIDKLRQLWNIDHKKNPNRSMVVINTMGWGTGKHKTEWYEILLWQ
ncbi:unnamed protein product [Adineta steineri]|uniref:Clp1 P-loop domain-containing protein n=1 Tax=Adineta steineri TaxID=433720 RepID=A0A816FXR3_9BILA|nr:unnamed protein product [Adineta steineri]CAF1667108.1 unnamed protein product [Adineta steineri]